MYLEPIIEYSNVPFPTDGRSMDTSLIITTTTSRPFLHLGIPTEESHSGTGVSKNTHRLLAEFDRLTDPTCCQLFRPVPGVNGTSLTLRFGAHEDLDDDAILLEYTGLVVGYLTGSIEYEERTNSGHIARFSCSPIQLSRLLFMLDMLSPVGQLTASSLVGQHEEEAWARAALDSSGFLTPWLEIGPTFETDVAFARPRTASLSVEPDMFRSLSSFFVAVGEALLGRGGYGGQDLVGLEEVVAKLWSLTERVTVTVDDPDRCKSTAERMIGPDFYETLLDTLKPYATLVVAGDPLAG